jgi:hypothetical protein
MSLPPHLLTQLESVAAVAQLKDKLEDLTQEECFALAVLGNAKINLQDTGHAIKVSAGPCALLRINGAWQVIQ